jgi:hypothetical protein
LSIFFAFGNFPIPPCIIEIKKKTYFFEGQLNLFEKKILERVEDLLNPLKFDEDNNGTVQQRTT